MGTELQAVCKPLFNTLAQTETIVTGEGTDISNTSTLRRRAERKAITQSIIVNLIDTAKQKEDNHKMQSYWNVYHCQNKVITSGSRLYTNYCKNRFCFVCSNIRRSEIINRYLPVIQTWKEPYFVTLTVRACKISALKSTTDRILSTFNKIKDKHRKRHIRNNGNAFLGIRSLECSFNPTNRTYNPHLHLIVATKEIAEILIKDWIIEFTSEFADKKSQDIQKINADTLIDVMKYITKTFADINPNIGNRYKQIYSSALDNIFEVMKGKRIFDRFGFNVNKTNVKPKSRAIALQDFKRWEFNLSITDWEDVENGKLLSGHTQNYYLNAILENCIDNKLE